MASGSSRSSDFVARLDALGERPIWWNPQVYDWRVTQITTNFDQVMAEISMGAAKVWVRQIPLESSDTSQPEDAQWSISWSIPESVVDHTPAIELSTAHLRSAFGLDNIYESEEGVYLRQHFGVDAGSLHKFLRSGHFVVLPGPSSADHHICRLSLITDACLRDTIKHLISAAER